MGEGHFRRSGGRTGAIESEFLMALVKPYVIIPGSNMVRGYDDLDSRFDALTAPSLVEMKGNWIGSLAAPGRGGTMGTWDQTADAYLYLGARDRLTVVKNRWSDLDGTAYGKELRAPVERSSLIRLPTSCRSRILTPSSRLFRALRHHRRLSPCFRNRAHDASVGTHVGEFTAKSRVDPA